MEYSPGQVSFIESTITHSFLQHPIISQLLYYFSAALFNPILWLFTVIGLFTIISMFLRGNKQDKTKAIALGSFIFPILTLLIYNHVGPYYYVYTLAPSAILVAVAADRYLSKTRRIPFEVPVLATLSILIIGFGFSTIHGQKYQRDVLKNIHTIFPKPVTYLDYCGMVPSFDRVLVPGLFINPDSLDNQRYFSETPFMEKLLQKHQPKFYLSNIAALDVDNVFAHSIQFKFSQADENALRNNFVHFWGPIYVAGKNLPQSDANTEIAFNIIVEGIYTYYGAPTVTLDGQKLTANSTIYLDAGQHTSSNVTSENAQIIWGDNLQKPEQIDTPKRLFWML